MNPLDKRVLGKSGVAVTILGFGAAMLGEQYRRLSEQEASQTVEAAYKKGINLFDTSPHYGHGLSEQRMGVVLRQKPRETYVLSTKVGRYLAPPTAERPLDLSPFLGGLEFNEVYDYTREGTLRAIDQSMARLGISSFECLVIHDVDIWTHGSEQAYREKFKEAMEGCYRVLDDLRSQGVVKAIGVGVNEVPVCMDFAAAGDFDFFDLAGRYTLLEQGGLDDFLPLCEKKNISIMLGALQLGKSWRQARSKGRTTTTSRRRPESWSAFGALRLFAGVTQCQSRRPHCSFPSGIARWRQ